MMLCSIGILHEIKDDEEFFLLCRFIRDSYLIVSI